MVLEVEVNVDVTHVVVVVRLIMVKVLQVVSKTSIDSTLVIDVHVVCVLVTSVLLVVEQDVEVDE